MSIQNTLDSVTPEEIADIEKRFGVCYAGLEDVRKEYYILGYRFGNSIVTNSSERDWRLRS